MITPLQAVGLLALAAALVTGLCAVLLFLPDGAHHTTRHPVPVATPTPPVTPPPPVFVVAGVAREAEIRTLLAYVAPEVARTRGERERREAETGQPWRDTTGSFRAIVAGDL